MCLIIFKSAKKVDFLCCDMFNDFIFKCVIFQFLCTIVNHVEVQAFHAQRTIWSRGSLN